VKLSDFDFSLPGNLIAQRPLPERDQSRMMVVNRKLQSREHRQFRDLPDILGRGDFLVLNSTKVFPARIRANRPGRREDLEVLLLQEIAPGDWHAMLKPGRKGPIGQEFELAGRRARVIEVRQDGTRTLRFTPPDGILDSLEREGEPPLPPYIERQRGEDLTQDRIRYQTVYARQTGSIAAPTAGLHFTPEVLGRLESSETRIREILLHVGCGTFQPVRSERVEDHRLEPEYFEISKGTAIDIRQWKSEGKRLIAVGTTTTRVLENWARERDPLAAPSSGFCNLFIYPGFEFKLLDGLLTNFHLPRSTLFMLVSAFAGREFMLDCYSEAIAERYRFFSYGDCMLIL
jgi:S-adenosylmethionine:tRNA ribosyltransferase-isomerase